MGLDIGGTNVRAGMVFEDHSLRDFEMTPSACLSEAPEGPVEALARYVRQYSRTHLEGGPA